MQSKTFKLSCLATIDMKLKKDVKLKKEYNLAGVKNNRYSF